MAPPTQQQAIPGQTPYQRGVMDSYYRRPRDPHKWLDNLGAERVEIDQMTPEEIADYHKGYNDNDELGDYKEWE